MITIANCATYSGTNCATCNAGFYRQSATSCKLLNVYNPNVYKTWANANSDCQNRGMRLPTKDELFGLYPNRGQFSYVADWLWSCYDSSAPRQAWLVHYGNGVLGDYFETDHVHYYFCVSP